MKPVKITIAPTTGLDRDGICLAQTRTGAGVLLINGALASGGVVTFDLPRRVGIYSAADLSALTFTVTGTNRQGVALSQAITGPTAGATVSTTANFATVTQVASSGTVGTNVEVGTTAVMESRWIPMDFSKNPFSVGMIFTLSAGASMTYGVQITLMDLNSLREHEITDFAAHPTISGETTSQSEMTTIGPATAYRVTVTWTSGTLTGYICQAG